VIVADRVTRLASAVLCFIYGTASAAPDAITLPWWQGAVVYEIYPRSFQDSNGDGVGDLNGITERLDYLEALGVDAIWIAPMYASPQVDFGYDISDYESVDPQYGTLTDFDNLLSEAHKRQIRVVVDMVLNHTSDKHSWFLESKSSRDNPKHEWYVWSEGKPGANGQPNPPNNWTSWFGGSAWEWVPGVEQFYYHAYYKQQPDLNWRNPEVERAMFDVLRFWLDRGVDGFRLDSIADLFEDAKLRDEPTLNGISALGDPKLSPIYTTNLPEIHDTIRRMRAMVSAYPGDRVLIGETAFQTTAELDAWYGADRHDELQLPMDPLVGFVDQERAHHKNKLDAALFRRRLLEADTQLHGSEPLLVFDNHDVARSWNRYGDGRHDAQIAKLIATILLTSRASALLYEGEEIGQRTETPNRREDVKDPVGITGWPKDKGRDGERTPMQWDDSNPQAGFSANPNTWLPVPDNYKTINVRSELSDPNSLLNWHKKLIELRHRVPALRDGKLVLLNPHDGNVLAYARVDAEGHAAIVALNMTTKEQIVHFNVGAAGLRGSELSPLMISAGSVVGTNSMRKISLSPFGVLVATLKR
jgi:alpha-glucosidase